MPRPRKSLAVHALSGTRPEYVTPDAPVFAPSKPKMPKDLTPAEEAEWKRVVRELKKRGTLTRVDSSLLEIYVRIWGRWKLLADDVKTHGAMVEDTRVDKHGEQYTVRVVNPAVKEAARLETSLRLYLQQFAATPASREAVRPAPRPAKVEYPEGSVKWIEQQLAQFAEEEAHDETGNGVGSGDATPLQADSGSSGDTSLTEG